MKLRGVLVTKTYNKTSVVASLIANVTILVGALFFDWSIYEIFILYWLETVVIGIFNVFKMIKVGNGLSSALLVPFFIFHFGFFMYAFLALIQYFFTPSGMENAGIVDSAELLSSLQIIWLPFIVLAANHAISFFTNFLGKQEYERTNIRILMTAPYRRVVVMHIALLFGGIVVASRGEPLYGLLILIAVKTILDVWFHIVEHTKLGDMFERLRD